ncbi:hypothetical protein NQ315_015745 [Exocentrus adspersus]|uniref:Lipase domain-containing protein n=1 Tax=Exocentrus adspersus TaxID=1586481 RepID=A0AAV8W3U0_9CUCU|nr:hypothetical protein NQ315_015745 [Exocentrus adspersus]
MVNLWVMCVLSNFTGPPKVIIDKGTYQLYPINKRLCPTFDPDRDTIFHLYTRENFNTSQTLRIGDEASVNNSAISFDRPTVIFFHGFLESSDSEDAQKIKNYYLNYGDVNVILVNNERLLAGPYYLTSSLNVEPIGKYSAQFVDFLVEQGLKLSDLHIIGMSLGAHIAGLTGKNLKSGKAPRVTGLDPAGPFFDLLGNQSRLAKGDADFVDVIHTNAGVFGTLFSSGDVDIWFNGGHFQPGCGPVSVLRRKLDIAELIFCNHYQAWRIYVKSLSNPSQYTAVKCSRLKYFMSGKCESGEETFVGVNVDKTARGSYFIKTGVTALDV